jgi:riboflavin synthase alpha subunit
MEKSRTYVGIDDDVNGAMTTIGKIIRDAWVFELIPETETCKGWNQGQIDVLLDKVNAEWDKYGCMVGQLPETLRERHQRIHDVAISEAKAAGWSGEQETIDDK